MKCLRNAAALVAGLLAGTPAARAQISPDLIMETYNANMSAITSAAISNANLRNIVDGTAHINSKKGIVVGRPGSRPAVITPAAATGSLSYATPSAALKAETVQGYVDRLKTKNPAAAQAISANLGPGKYDYGTIYHGILAGQGLRDNNAADALSAYLILGWMIVNNVQDGKAITPAMAQGVSRQFTPKLAANPQISAPGIPAQLGEEMKLLFVVVQGGWQSALKEKTLPAYQQGVAAMYQEQYGLNLKQLKITSEGFAQK